MVAMAFVIWLYQEYLTGMLYTLAYSYTYMCANPKKICLVYIFLAVMLFVLYHTEPYKSEQEEIATPSYQDNLDPPLGGVYHLVVDGKAFSVIREHCPEVMERVSGVCVCVWV